jgi:hypothetical protein
MVRTTALQPVSENVSVCWCVCVYVYVCVSLCPVLGVGCWRRCRLVGTCAAGSLKLLPSRTCVAGWLAVACRSFDMGAQVWNARSLATGAIVSTLADGVKYLVGVKWLPTGWEVG